MKHSGQTRLTAALFAAALGISATGSTVSAADTAFPSFSPEEQQIAAILYGPPPNYDPPETGDMNDDKVLDARDLTLMKQRLLRDEESYSGTADFNRDICCNGTDARALMQQLTGEAQSEQRRPTGFTLYFRPVPYFQDAVPADQNDRGRLTEEANLRLRRIADYITNPASYQPEFVYLIPQKRLEKELWPRDKNNYAPEWGDALCTFYRMDIPDGFAPNTFFEDGANETGVLCMHRTEISFSMLLEDMTQKADVSEDPDAPAPMMNRSGYSGSFPTYVRYTDGHEEYYDKILIEWNVNTGEYRMYDSLTPEQEITG